MSIQKTDKYRHAYDFMKPWGLIVPATAVTALSHNGNLQNSTPIGALTNSNDADGRCKLFTSGTVINNEAGFLETAANYCNTKTQWNPIIRVKFKLGELDNHRFWVGLFSNDPGALDDPSAMHCAGIRCSHGAANTNFVVYTSDGAGNSNILDFPVPIPKNSATLNTFDMVVSGNGSVIDFYLNGQVLRVTTFLPVLTIDLGAVFKTRNYVGGAGTACSLRFYMYGLKADK